MKQVEKWNSGKVEKWKSDKAASQRIKMKQPLQLLMFKPNNPNLNIQNYVFFAKSLFPDMRSET